METLPWPWGAPCPPWPHKAYVSLGAQLQAWGGRSRWLQSGTGALPAAVRCQPPPRLGWRCHAICSPRLAPPPGTGHRAILPSQAWPGAWLFPEGFFSGMGKRGGRGGDAAASSPAVLRAPIPWGICSPWRNWGEAGVGEVPRMVACPLTPWYVPKSAGIGPVPPSPPAWGLLPPQPEPPPDGARASPPFPPVLGNSLAGHSWALLGRPSCKEN